MKARYQTLRLDDTALSEIMKALAHKRRRFGYRRLHMLMRHEVREVNYKRLFRMYREEKLHVRRRGGRKRAIGTRAPMLVPLEQIQIILKPFRLSDCSKILELSGSFSP